MGNHKMFGVLAMGIGFSATLLLAMAAGCGDGGSTPPGDNCLVDCGAGQGGAGGTGQGGTPGQGGTGGVVECSPSEGAPCIVPEAMGICANGTTACDGSCAQVMEPTAETCDGTDENCDGSVDDGFFLGMPCTTGLGACVATGVLLCDTPTGTKCDATPGEPGVETCNGLDDNCDGSVDDGFNVGAACSVGVGACTATGSFLCSNGGAICSASPGNPGQEVCGNGIDENCNGVVDEGCTDCSCFESDQFGNPKASGPYDAKKICRASGGYDFYLCDPALGCQDFPAGTCPYGGFHP